MSDNVIQTSFAAGELAPSIFARTDLAKYHSGAQILRNFFVDYRSGASTRTGTKAINQVYNTNLPTRLIPFQYSTITSYILEFGHLYVRFINNGATVLEAPFAIIGVGSLLPCILNIPGNNFLTGDWIFVSGVVGMTPLNGNYYQVSVAGGAVTLHDISTGNPIDASAFPAYISGGTAARVYTLPSPYAASDLALLKFTQTASVLTITHPSYAPRNLVITSATNWAFNIISFATPILPPTSLSTATSSAGTANYSFIVTSVDALGNESGPSTAVALASAVNIFATAGTLSVIWAAPSAGVQFYNVYMAEPNIGTAVPATAAYGFIGQTPVGGAATFINSNIAPDFSTTPPIPSNPFAGANNPAVNCYFQQRQCFAASNSNPTTFWMGQPGGFTPTSANFNVSSPIQPDDAITGTIVSTQVNAIKWMLPMPGGLVVGTSKGAWQITAGTGQNATVAVTPANATAIPQAYNGTSDIPPIVVNYDIIYVQAKGSIVRDLSYNIYANIYTGTDITVLSNHLFFGHQILQWAYAEEPFKTIWAVREDGILLSLTFVKEQEIYGWARHDTLGQYLSIASVTEGQVDAVYVIVNRFLNGRFVQMIERFMERTFVYGAEDAWNVDCGIQSSLVYPAATLTVSGTTAVRAPSPYPLGPLGAEFVATGIGTFRASAPVFSAGSVGQILRVGGGIAKITQYNTPTQVIGTIIQPISQVLHNDITATPLPATQGNWSLTPQFTKFTGLNYLNGQTVSILADGGVVTPQVVVNGAITLNSPASKVTVGLGFQAQLQTMPLDVGEPTIQGKRKKINALTVRAANSRGLKAGRTFSTLVPIKELNPNVALGQAIPLVTGDERIVMDPLWDVPGLICLQQDDPLPATVLGVIPEITVGDK